MATTSSQIRRDCSCLIDHADVCRDLLKLQRGGKAADYLSQSASVWRDLQATQPSVSWFKVIKVIGTGMFGKVALVKSKKSNQVYAMKTILKASSQSDMAQCIEERDVMLTANGSQRSKWITHLYYAFHDTHSLYLVMDYHPGGDLFTLLNRLDVLEIPESEEECPCLPERMAKFYILETLFGLRELHNLGYIHRDIKPENVMISADGHLRLVDFGSSVKVDTSGKHHGRAVGTPAYLAKELTENIITDQTAGLDIWAVGCLSYELLLGDVPFGDEQLEVARNLSKDDPAKDLEYLEGTSQEYKDFVAKCLCKVDERISLDECLAHPLLASLDFDVELNEVSMAPPFVPAIGGPEDTSHFEDIEASELRAFDQRNKRQVSSSGFDANELQWMGFTYSCEDAVLEGFGSGLANTTVMANGDESMLIEVQTRELDMTKEQRDRHKKAASEAKAQLATMKWRMTTMAMDKQQLQAVKAEVVGLKDENRALQRQQRQLEASKAELEADLATSEAELVKVTKNFEAERAHLKAAKARRQTDTNLAESGRHAEQLQDAEAANKQLGRQLSQAQTERDQARQELRTAQKQKAASRNQIVELETELTEAKEELAARQQQLSSVDEIMRSYQDEIHKLEAHQQDIIKRDLAAIRTAADDLKLAHDDQERLRAKLKRYRQRYEDTHFQAQEWKNRYEEQVTSREKFRQHYKKQIIKLEAELSKAQYDQGAENSSRLSHPDSSVRAAARTRVATRTTQNNACEACQAKERQITRLKVELARVQDDYQGTLDRLVEVEHGLDATQLHAPAEVSATGLDGLYSQIGGSHPTVVPTRLSYANVEGHTTNATVVTPSPKVVGTRSRLSQMASTPSNLSSNLSTLSNGSVSSTPLRNLSNGAPASPLHIHKKPPSAELGQAIDVLSMDGGPWQRLQLLLSSSWLYLTLPEDATVAIYEHCLSDTDATFRLHESVPRSQLRQHKLTVEELDRAWSIEYKTRDETGESLVLLSTSRSDKDKAVAALRSAIRVHESPLDFQAVPALELEDGRVQDIVGVPGQSDLFLLATVNGVDTLRLKTRRDGLQGISSATGNYASEVFELVVIPSHPDVVVMLSGPYRVLATASIAALIGSAKPVPFSPRQRAPRRTSTAPASTSKRLSTKPQLVEEVTDAHNIDEFAVGSVDGQTFLLAASHAVGLILYVYDAAAASFTKLHVASEPQYMEPVIDLQWSDTLASFVWTTDIFNTFDPVTRKGRSLLNRDQPSLRPHFERELNGQATPVGFASMSDGTLVLAFTNYGLVVNRFGGLVHDQAELPWPCGPITRMRPTGMYLCLVGVNKSIGLYRYASNKWHDVHLDDVTAIMVANSQLFVCHQHDVNTESTTLSVVQRPLDRFFSSVRESTRKLRRHSQANSSLADDMDEIERVIESFETVVDP
eukprot:m.186583 g.186583  ORF g.186583 m.186583 type:complete len:1417 (+) comp16922_c0_seq3:100-4350(+)